MPFMPEQAGIQPDGASPLRHPLRSAMNALRGGNLATLTMAALTPIGAGAMLAPSIAQADHPPEGTLSSRPSSQPITFGPGITFSNNQCGNNGRESERLCGTGCGVMAATDAVSDLESRAIDPLSIFRILNPDYYIPGSGTLPEGFAVVARHYGLEEQPSNLQGAKKALKEEGGVAISEFNNSVAISRSGGSSSVAVVDHYVVLDAVTNDGRFAMADPHQGADRHNERTRNGQIRFWSGREMRQEGLINVWTITP